MDNSLSVGQAAKTIYQCLRCENNGLIPDSEIKALKTQAHTLDLELGPWWHGICPPPSILEKIGSLQRRYEALEILELLKRPRANTDPAKDSYANVALLYPKETRTLIEALLARGTQEFPESFEPLEALRTHLRPIDLSGEEIHHIVQECQDLGSSDTSDSGHGGLVPWVQGAEDLSDDLRRPHVLLMHAIDAKKQYTLKSHFGSPMPQIWNPSLEESDQPIFGEMYPDLHTMQTLYQEAVFRITHKSKYPSWVAKAAQAFVQAMNATKFLKILAQRMKRLREFYEPETTLRYDVIGQADTSLQNARMALESALQDYHRDTLTIPIKSEDIRELEQWSEAISENLRKPPQEFRTGEGKEIRIFNRKNDEYSGQQEMPKKRKEIIDTLINNGALISAEVIVALYMDDNYVLLEQYDESVGRMLPSWYGKMFDEHHARKQEIESPSYWLSIYTFCDECVKNSRPVPGVVQKAAQIVIQKMKKYTILERQEENDKNVRIRANLEYKIHDVIGRIQAIISCRNEQHCRE